MTIVESLNVPIAMGGSAWREAATIQMPNTMHRDTRKWNAATLIEWCQSGAGLIVVSGSGMRRSIACFRELRVVTSIRRAHFSLLRDWGKRGRKKGRNLGLARGLRPLPDFTGILFGGGGG